MKCYYFYYKNHKVINFNLFDSNILKFFSMFLICYCDEMGFSLLI